MKYLHTLPVLFFLAISSLLISNHAYATNNDCDCDNNVLKNSSFETIDDGRPTEWTYVSQITGAGFGYDDDYWVCGRKNGLLKYKGYIYQDVAVAGGSTATLSIWGGYHNKSGQKFQLIFLDASKNPVGTTVTKELTKSVKQGTGPNGMTLYNLTGVAPTDAKFVRVLGSLTDEYNDQQYRFKRGDYLKIDQACLTITPPPVDCEGCKDNALKNPSFENKTGDKVSDWTFFAAVNNPKSNISTFIREDVYEVCGQYNGLMHYSGKFYQDVALTNGFKVDLKIWGGYHSQAGQKFQLIFLDVNKNKLKDSVEVALNKSVTDLPKTGPHGMTQYTLNATAPAGSKFVRVQGIATGDYFKVDFGCLTLTPPPPLPVTLVDFKVAPENNQANLSWSTVSEINAMAFDIEHSGDGKQWANLGSVAAKGESSALISYNFIHHSPSVGNNLYRLKMIDADETFAYSKIVNIKFEGTGMTIYPNPTSSKIKLSETGEKVDKVQLINLSGAMLLQAVPDSANEIDLSRIPQGSYVVRIYKAGGAIISQKIQVIK